MQIQGKNRFTGTNEVEKVDADHATTFFPEYNCAGPFIVDPSKSEYITATEILLLTSFSPSLFRSHQEKDTLAAYTSEQ